MKMYRLTQKKFADTPFNPMGAKLFRGRWNSKGIEALYFAESESLCVLEVFVHINNDPELIHKYDLYRIDVPDELIVQLENEDLPNNWRAIPASEQTQEIGDQFLKTENPELQHFKFHQRSPPETATMSLIQIIHLCPRYLTKPRNWISALINGSSSRRFEP